MKKTLFIFILLKITLVICEKYDLQHNKIINSTLNPIWFIQSNIKHTKIQCLSACNLNDECYTATFSTNSMVNDNCFLYRKQLSSTEIISSQDSNIYIKQCIPIRTLNNIACLIKRMFYSNLNSVQK